MVRSMRVLSDFHSTGLSSGRDTRKDWKLPKTLTELHVTRSPYLFIHIFMSGVSHKKFQN